MPEFVEWCRIKGPELDLSSADFLRFSSFGLFAVAADFGRGAIAFGFGVSTSSSFSMFCYSENKLIFVSNKLPCQY
jgi:hypothetical protein